MCSKKSKIHTENWFFTIGSDKRWNSLNYIYREYTAIGYQFVKNPILSFNHIQFEFYVSLIKMCYRSAIWDCWNKKWTVWWTYQLNLIHFEVHIMDHFIVTKNLFQSFHFYINSNGSAKCFDFSKKKNLCSKMFNFRCFCGTIQATINTFFIGKYNYLTINMNNPTLRSTKTICFGLS